MHSPPSPAMIVCVSCAATKSRSTANTLAPSRANNTAVALPLLQPGAIEPEPATIATLPFRRAMGAFFFRCSKPCRDQAVRGDALQPREPGSAPMPLPQAGGGKARTRNRDPAFMARRLLLQCARNTASGHWPFRRRQRTVDRIDLLLPPVWHQHDQHRRADATARCVELHAARERIGRLTSLEIELVDLLVHLSPVGNARTLQRLLDNPSVTVACKAVLRDPRLP